MVDNYQTETVHCQTTQENEESNNNVVARGVCRLYRRIDDRNASENSMIKFGDVMLKSVVEVEESTLKIEEVLSRENVLENVTIFVTKLNEDIATIKDSYSSVRSGLTSSSTGIQFSLITLSVFISLLAF